MIKYTHYKKEGEYYIVDYCMIQENDKWVEGIVYMAVGSNKKFVRSEKEFEEKFKIDMKEYILCSAVWYKEFPHIKNTEVPINSFLPKNLIEGVVFCGFRHGQCIYSKCAVTGLRDAESGEHIQGFLTSKNRFVDRQEAWNIAKQADQIIKVSGGEGTLYSEDLW